MEEILIVDGYNIIGAWPKLSELKARSLEESRDELLSILGEYQAYSGIKVLVIFDAYRVPGIGKKYREHQVDVYYTRENETADEMIEKLVKSLSSRKRRIYVATSDYTEQWVTFGSGALRKSARELLIDVENSKKEIKNKVTENNQQLKKSTIKLDEKIKGIFEKWRRQ